MPLLTNKFAKIAAAADKVFFDSTEGSPKGFGLRVTRNGAKKRHPIVSRHRISQ